VAPPGRYVLAKPPSPPRHQRSSDNCRLPFSPPDIRCFLTAVAL
jgi:hypothetical protein